MTQRKKEVDVPCSQCGKPMETKATCIRCMREPLCAACYWLHVQECQKPGEKP